MKKNENILITEFLGDGIGPELQRAVHRVAAELPLRIVFDSVDLTLENRQKTGPVIYDQAMASIGKTKLAFKYPTVTKGESPNAKLRNLCRFSVIHRPVISIPGIDSNFKKDLELHIVRVATGGTYEHAGERITHDVAVSLRIVEREPCRHAAEFAFRLAEKTGKTVTSSSKYTIQRVTDGLFEDIVKEVGQKYPLVPHQTELFDALLAKMILKPHQFQVVVTLNEYGDFLSDMACGLVGSLGTGASGNYAFDAEGRITVAMFDPAGGTAPDIAGKDIANPTAAFLAFSMLLNHVDRYDLGHALRLAIRNLIEKHECTPDIGGKLSLSTFTDRVIQEFKNQLKGNS